MTENFREFDVGPDPAGKMWVAKFAWLQTAVSIRHSDSVDVKYFLIDGERRVEKVIALMHADLLALSRKANRPLTDPWCMKLAGLHLKRMVETGEDFEKSLVTLSPDDLDKYNAMLE